MEKINYIIKEPSRAINLPSELGFGRYFTNHIFEMDYLPEKGWCNPTIKPFTDMAFHPATMVLHYGQAIFEGIKAFKTINGDAVIFRAETHIERLNNSARRICIPEVDVNFVVDAMRELVSIEKDWIPTNKGEALYIRPFIFGMDPFLGVNPSKTYRFLIILSPVGAYYPRGFVPVKILVQDDYVRAVRKGLGECKTPANYAASLLAAEVAKKKGFDQVLWLDGVEQKYIEEVGTMNIFITFKDEIVTPKLNGSILPGVTRRSVIQILEEWGENINQRMISIDEIVDSYKTGRLVGIFGTGTAAIISSVGMLSYKENDMLINNGKPGELDLRLFEELTSIHYGIKPDTHNWLTYTEKKGIELV